MVLNLHLDPHKLVASVNQLRQLTPLVLNLRLDPHELVSWVNQLRELTPRRYTKRPQRAHPVW